MIKKLSININYCYFNKLFFGNYNVLLLTSGEAKQKCHACVAKWQRTPKEKNIMSRMARRCTMDYFLFTRTCLILDLDNF